MSIPTRQTIITLLEKWQGGELDAGQVLLKAESLYENIGDSEFEKSDEESIVIESLSQLEILHHQWITPSDIPAFLDFLNTPEGEELDGWRKWESYWENLDYEERKKQLIDGPKIYGVTQDSSIRV